MARDPDTIQREIEQTRDALASTLDQLGTKASPKRIVDSAKASAWAKLEDPRVRYVLVGAGVLVTFLVIRKLFR